MPTRKQVESWNTAKLSEWATELETDTQHYETELGRMLPHFSGTNWSGAAHDAASDRFTEEHDQGRKLSQEIRDVAAALRSADQRLANERRLLLGKVGEAENDPMCPVRLQVADNWAVSGTGTGLSQGDQQTVTDKVHAHQDAINAAYYSLANAISEVGIAITTATREVRVRGDQIGDGVSVTSVSPNDSGELGKEDGEALAAWANGSLPDKENTEILEEIAGRLPQGTLTEEQLRVLAAGGEVDNLPADVQEYYRSLYQAAGKDGILALSEHLRTEEAAGNPDAAGQLDTLANGLMVVSNEDIGTGRNPDGTLTNPGSYQQLPESVRQLLESRRTDPDPLEPDVPGGPTAGLQKQWQDTNALAALFGEAHPSYEPGTELGTQMVLKSSDMVQDQFDWPGRDDAAAQFLDVAGRNDDTSHQIWTGEGMPEGYKPDETVRSLLGYDWSESDNGAAASTMINRITEEAALPADDPRGLRGREALMGLGAMLAPDDGAVWEKSKEGIANSPELSAAISRAVSTNLESVSVPGMPAGFTQSVVYPDGRVQWNGEEANRLMQLAGYSEEGRVTLTAAVEQYRLDELARAMRDNPGNVAGELAASDVGALTGRADNAIWDALIHKDKLEGEEFLNPTDAMYQAKTLGAQVVGGIADQAVGIVKPVETAVGITGIEAGSTVEDAVKKVLDADREYEFKQRPSEQELAAEAVDNANQAILNAAYSAGALPPQLQTEAGPLGMPEIRANANAWAEFQDFVVAQGLSQYIQDYSQSYQIALGRQGGS
ncbi:hypothetical protein [Nocardia carnea]|uniref:TPR repeat region-containing protein n=1 Tax=Nocardia carnea TaxID=37328 RepID=UPI002455DEA1|nr:hypothetical protein [Nocardia carnea]